MKMLNLNYGSSSVICERYEEQTGQAITKRQMYLRIKKKDETILKICHQLRKEQAIEQRKRDRLAAKVMQ